MTYHAGPILDELLHHKRYMSLSPIFVHRFSLPVPYVRTLALQERLHSLQLAARGTTGNHKDLLLLLEHRPVFTAGRRMGDAELTPERVRLEAMGGELIATQRGGELTYHGPGQLVGYPLLDLERAGLGTREYVCALQTTLKRYLRQAHGIEAQESEHTGVFLDARTKIASIGCQVRHRLTTHGFSINITEEPRSWFDQVIACGLADVKAGSVQSALAARNGGYAPELSVPKEANKIAHLLGEALGRRVEVLNVESEGSLGEAIQELEEDARRAGPWHHAPKLQST
jgi:lipoyl(octanoyl) transferase 2